MARCVTLLCKWILLSCIVGVAHGVSISDPPDRVTTVLAGTSVTLRCGVDGPLDSNYVLWKYMSDDTELDGKQLYDSLNGDTINANKYELAGEYNLKILNMQLTDGGTYGCILTPSEKKEFADIVVLNEPVLESGAVSVSAGETVTIRCAATFGSENLDNTPAGAMKPQMSIWVGAMNSNAKPIIEWAKSGVEHRIVAEVEYTGDVGDDKKIVSCRVYGGEQQQTFLASANNSVSVRFPLQSPIDYTPRKNVYYVGSNITCIARSNPPAEVTWTAVRTPADRRTVSGWVLSIEADMKGENEWTCDAVDQTSNRRESVPVTFTVAADPDDGGSGASSTGKKSSWPIAVGIVVAIVVICVIVIVVFLFLRKRRMAGDDIKMPPAALSPQQGQTNGTKDGSGTPVPSTPQPENPGYAGPYKGDGSQNDVSVYPGRESPGYGDLGIRHMGGSNPGLDSQVNTAPDPGASRAVRPAAYSNDMFQGSPKLGERQQLQKDGGSAV